MKELIWCGCASILDGHIEETHSYAEAEHCDFHHSFYFSEEAVIKIDEGDSFFFWIDKGMLRSDWNCAEVSIDLLKKVSDQLWAKVREVEMFKPITI